MEKDIPGFVKVVFMLIIIACMVSCVAGDILDYRAKKICISNGYNDGETYVIYGLNHVVCLTKFKLDTQYNLLEE